MDGLVLSIMGVVSSIATLFNASIGISPRGLLVNRVHYTIAMRTKQRFSSVTGKTISRIATAGKEPASWLAQSLETSGIEGAPIPRR
jgi:hypothetical protein